MLHLTTYFDKNYLSRGLILYDSLKKHNQNFELYILCLDDFTHDFFTKNKDKYQEIKILTLSEIEQDDSALLTAKKNRSKIEYYFTLSPCLPLYLLKKHQLPHICSLDADILFLDDPRKIFDQLNEYSVIVTPHKFSNEIKHLSKYGIYNVSFQIFKNNATGLTCLEDWKKDCLNWCGDEYDEINDRFADQKYLDKWNTKYPHEVLSLNDNCSGLAPWNVNNYLITKKKEHFLSNNENILFYHFHHFKILSKKWATNGFKEYKVQPQSDLDLLYLYYWNLIDLNNEALGITQDQSTRYQSSAIWPTILKEKIVYKKTNSNNIKQVNFGFIPKFIRKLIIKIYA
ncbi:MAG: hypothetical protein ACOVMH_00765 [Flavobacterium sp.]